MPRDFTPDGTNVQSIADAKAKKEGERPAKILPKDLHLMMSAILTRELPSTAPLPFTKNKFPHKIRAIRSSAEESLAVLLAIDEQTNVCRRVSLEWLAGELICYLDRLAAVAGNEQSIPWQITYKKALDAVGEWIAKHAEVGELPAAVGFANETDVCFHRLPFALEPGPWDEWSNICGRMDNGTAFMVWMGGLLEPGADRKQALYIWGPSDCGKSQIEQFTAAFLGPAHTSISPGVLETPYYKAMLVGKRLATISEAAPSFFRSEAFKSLTGDDWHTVEEKFKPAYRAKLEIRIAAFSNHKPSMDNKDELLRRIIPIEFQSHGLPVDQLMPQAEYQAILWREAPGFLHQCRKLYKKYADRGRRIPCKQEKLIESAHEHEMEITETFHEHFVVAPESKVRGSDIQAVLRAKKVHYSQQKRYLEVWKRSFGVTFEVEKETRRKNYVGMRARQPGDPVYVPGEKPF